MVVDDSRSIGQVMFMSSPSDEHSFWVKSSRTPEDTRILSRPLVDTHLDPTLWGDYSQQWIVLMNNPIL